MALAVIRRIISGPNRGTNAHASESLLEGGSVVLKAGAPVIASSGLIVLDTTTDGSSSTTPVGIAEEDGHNATSGTKNIRVMLAEGGQVFEGTLATSSGGTGGAPLAATLVQTDAWITANLAMQDSTGLWYIDRAGTNDRVLIVGFRDPVGTVNPRVYFKFLNSKAINA